MPPPDFTTNLRKQLWPPLVVGGGFVVFFWGWYLKIACFGVEPRNPVEGSLHFQKTFLLITAVGVTVIVAIVCWRIVRRQLALIEHGLRADATLVDVGGVGGHGQMPVTFAYTVAGRRYTVTEAIDIDVLNLLEDDTIVGVAYDPRNPARATLLRNEFPTPAEPTLREAAADGAREMTDHAIHAALFFGVFLAALLLFARIIQSYDLHPDDESALTTPAAVLSVGLAMAAVTVRDWRRTRGNRRLRKVTRTLTILSAALLIGSVAWGVINLSGIPDRVARRRVDAAQKDEMRDLLQRAEAGAKAYEDYQARQATRPTTRPTPRPRPQSGR